MSKIGNKYVAWIKLANGAIGIALTVMWFIFMVGNPVVITLAGVPVAGSLIFSCILIGNAYGLWCLAKDGHTTLQEWKAVKLMHESYTQYQKDLQESWETTTKWNENDE